MTINIFFYLTFVFFSLGQLGRISFFGQQVSIYLYEIFLVITLFFLFLKYQFKPVIYAFYKFKSICIFFLILVITYLLTLLRFYYFENLIGLLYLLRLTLYFLYFFYLTYHIRINLKFVVIIFKALNIFLFITLIFSLVQYLFYQDLRNLFYLGWDPHLLRMFGTFFDTFLSSAIYGLLFLFILFQVKKNLKFFLLPIIFIFLILTFSRASYVAFLISLTVFFLRKKFYKTLFLILFAFVLILLLVPKPSGEGVNLKRKASLNARWDDYKRAIGLFQKNPLLGVGYDRIRYAKKQIGLVNDQNFEITHAGAGFHSSFLIILVSSGVLGLLVFVKMVFDLAKISLFSKIYLIFVSLFSLFDNVLLHPFVLLLLFTLLSLEVRSIFFSKSDS